MSNEVDTVQSTQQAKPFLPNMGNLQFGFDEASRLYPQSGGNSALNQYITGLQSRVNDPGFQNNKSQVLDIGRKVAMGDIGWQPTQTLQDFESGKFLNPESNPWLQSFYDDAAGRMRGQIASQFGGAGRYGSGAMGDAMGTGLSNLANQMYGGAYQQGQAQRLQASGLMNQMQDNAARTQLAGATLYPQLFSAVDADSRALIAAQQQQQDQPWANLQRYMGIVNPGINFGSSTTSSQPFYSNPFGQAVGAAGGLLQAGKYGLDLYKSFGGGNPLTDISDGVSSLFGSGGFDPAAMDFSAAIDPFASYGYF
jgi:hypothetical protein